MKGAFVYIFTFALLFTFTAEDMEVAAKPKKKRITSVKKKAIRTGKRSRRYYYEYVPRTTKANRGQKLRLIYLFHGYQRLRTNAGVGFMKIVEKSVAFNDTILIAPTLLRTRRTSWNHGSDYRFLKKLHRMLLKKYGKRIDKKQVYAVGFSMGVNFALQAGLKQVLPVAAAAGVGGGIKLEDDELIEKKIPVLLIMGESEPKKRKRYGLESMARMRNWGLDVKYTGMPVGHGVNFDVVARIFDWLHRLHLKSGMDISQVEYKGIDLEGIEP